MDALDALPDGNVDDVIAVVGMSCRFPGDADNVENFWEMIREGKDAWSEIPSDRFNAKGWYHPDPNRPGSFHIRGAHFIKGDIAAFDAPPKLCPWIPSKECYWKLFMKLLTALEFL
ncbi:phenolpthiocerol synthesis polyketide synthase PpsB [Sporothrix schenckii ATCC 58251]|uniref:Phenolpthiocerol synthesis polyketide synthase PpsB n=1 Tax=Sporothrix schenckii (strain ATCC 58251 / de Perez 2211183) TaxID=1391915 RepID=U7PXS4_SPOS1|nr:phenolpthiocerol synthesis polyketide synthase PpsB [Sporothrix schenckii ATCC 58251]